MVLVRKKKSFYGHACGVRVQRVLKVQRVQRERLTALRAEGCGRLPAAGCVEGLWKKVLKIDWPFRARGFLGLTAFQAEGCGIALSVHSEHILKER